MLVYPLERPLLPTPQNKGRGRKWYYYPTYSFHPTTIIGGLVTCYMNLSSRSKLKKKWRFHKSKMNLCPLKQGNSISTSLLQALVPSMITVNTLSSVAVHWCWDHAKKEKNNNQLEKFESWKHHIMCYAKYISCTFTLALPRWCTQKLWFSVLPFYKGANQNPKSFSSFPKSQQSMKGNSIPGHLTQKSLPPLYQRLPLAIMICPVPQPAGYITGGELMGQPHLPCTSRRPCCPEEEFHRILHRAIYEALESTLIEVKNANGSGWFGLHGATHSICEAWSNHLPFQSHGALGFKLRWYLPWGRSIGV